MRVSIALCTYNGERYLPEQLRSFELQTVKPDEIVVCDDGSSDQSIALLKEFAAGSSIPLRIFENGSNLGSTRNFDKAVTLCTGDVILFSDQDDAWMPEKIDLMLKAFRACPEAGYVFSNARLVGPEGDALGTLLWDTVGFDEACQSRFAAGNQVEVMLRRSVVTGATMGFRRTLLPLVAPFCELWVHDGWIALLSSASRSKGVFLREALISYRQHQAQQIGAKTATLRGNVGKLGAGAGGMLERERSRFEAVRARLLEHGLHDSPEITLLTDKITHLSSRLEMAGAGTLVKAGAVIREALTGRYQRYSNSWQSMISDISQR